MCYIWIKHSECASRITRLSDIITRLLFVCLFKSLQLHQSEFTAVLLVTMALRYDRNCDGDENWHQTGYSGREISFVNSSFGGGHYGLIGYSAIGGGTYGLIGVRLIV